MLVMLLQHNSFLPSQKET